MGRLKGMVIISVVLGVVLAMGPMAPATYAQDEGDGLAVPDETESIAPAVTYSGSGKLLRFRYVTSNTIGQSTDSSTLVQVPNMSHTFTTTRQGSMVITYSAVTFAAGTNTINVVAQVDGADAMPGQIQFSGDDHTHALTRTFTWVARGIPAGTHTVRIMWRRSSGTGLVYMHWRSMIVQYKR